MIEFKRNKLFINGQLVRKYRENSNAFTLASILLGKKSFTREFAISVCMAEGISVASLDVELHTLNKLTEEKFGEKLFIRKDKGINPTYCINQFFLDEPHTTIELYVPLSKLKEIEDYIKPFKVADESY